MEAVGAAADGGGPVGLFQVHVEDVEAHAAVWPGSFGEGVSLVGAVDEVGLEAVDGLNAQ